MATTPTLGERSHLMLLSSDPFSGFGPDRVGLDAARYSQQNNTFTAYDRQPRGNKTQKKPIPCRVPNRIEMSPFPSSCGTQFDLKWWEASKNSSCTKAKRHVWRFSDQSSGVLRAHRVVEIP